MDKEREPSQGRQRREQLTAPSATVILPNPYKSSPSLRGNHSLRGSAATDNSSLGKHGYNKPVIKVNTIRHKTETTGDLQTKTSMGNPKSPGHGRKDMKRRGREMPETTFEVKMDEFPELSGIFVDQGDPRFQRHCWGPPTQNLEEHSDKVNKNAPVANYKPPAKYKFPQTEVIPNSSGNAMAQESIPGSVTSSWANIASQPPKKPVLKDKAKPAQADEVVQEEEEVNTGKKKRKKKKKKSKDADEDMETGSDKNVLYQDPPRFEDEEEFPGLTPSFTGTEKLFIRSKTAHLCNNENQRQSIQQQPMNQKKDKTQNTKAPFTEAPKVQKAEKVSGKKSKVPVQLDIGNMLAVLEKKQSQKAKQDTKPLTLSVGGGLPVVPKQPPVQKKPVIQGKIAHNPLDSTSPLVKKGKQREVPKAKKPTALKKVILKEREERKQRRLLEERGELPESESVHAEAEEEDCETSAADEVLSPTEELGDQMEINDDEEEEKVEHEEPPQELTTSPTTIITPMDTPKIHSRKFREYCTQMLSKEVDECVTTLLKELVRFQDRLYQKDPMKARMKRRIVMGLREVLKHLKLRKVKCVIISPNCERSQAKGGLDEALHTIIHTCREQDVPFIFALSRKALGRCVNKAVPVSLVGIFNFDGAQDIYHKMIELSSEARKAYEAMLLSLEQTEPETSAETEQPFVSEQIQTGLNGTLSEEPEYIKLWKKLLEKENHAYMNFEEQLSSMCLDSECTEHDDDGAS
ncbi:selenocysteine insertion sequence-binding protein 2-like isoform X2 [Periophthalmus magnuspinnatus]|uniref:selenocysteine insertion sequence-binding protein 2-like isoform X2 n=1 Tax=Periophthalmus magnuspinnatus TaxID=409849 RepID=UPI002436D349|nr:selenocysteine insertion sequence-binding protein 2-like isoform X2 [Periophthalmus magnuspinnatus]